MSGRKSVFSILSFSFHKVCSGTVLCDHNILHFCLEHGHAKGRGVRGPGHRQNSRSLTRPHCLWRLLPRATLYGLFRWSLDVCRYFRQAKKGRSMWVRNRLPSEFTPSLSAEWGVGLPASVLFQQRAPQRKPAGGGGGPCHLPFPASPVTAHDWSRPGPGFPDSAPQAPHAPRATPTSGSGAPGRGLHLHSKLTTASEVCALPSR